MNHDAVLTIENLEQYFPLRKGLFAALSKGKQSYLRAVDNISFSVGEKEILGFVGESGCGKSTLSRTILQLVEPTGGKIHFKGTRVDTLSRKLFKPFRRKMQMIFQDPFGSLNPRRTVSEILRQTIRIHNLGDSTPPPAAIHPISTGRMPQRAPGTTARTVFLFNGV